MSRVLRCLASAFLAGFLIILAACPVPACPFCSMQGQTLTKEVNDASMVILGTISNPKLNADGLEGTTDLIIDEVVKPHPFLKDKKSIVLPRYIPESKVKFLIFCTFFKDRVDPYRGMPVKDAEIVTYLKGALALEGKDVPARLAFFFPYLEHPEIEISTDAYKEFAAADAKDVIKMIAQSDRSKLKDKLIEWLKNPETASYRYGLYGYLLGLCGKSEDAEVLVQLLNDPRRGLVSNIDGVLAGYVTLRPTEGWQYVLAILSNPKGDFTRRYAALRAIRFFWEYSPDLIKAKDLIAGVDLLLDQPDIADLAIEDLRRWKQWDHLDRILAISSKPGHDVGIIQRAILRFALTCPDPKAAAFVAEQRKKNPERVKDVEELLKLEQPAAAPAGK